MKIFRASLPILAFALLAACGQGGVDDGDVLATVNGEAITEQEYQEYAEARALQQPPQADAEKERQAVLEEMISRVLLAQEAVSRELDQEPDVRFQIKRQRENILARALLRDYMDEQPITDAEVRARYDQELAKTHKTEYRARHILLDSEEEANAVIGELRKGGNFAAIAKARSTDVRSAREGGDLGWFNQGQMVPEFFNAVMAMRKGETSSQAVKTEFGWHVIRIEDARPLSAPAFAEVQDGIRQLVQQERIEKMVKDLRARAKVENGAS